MLGASLKGTPLATRIFLGLSPLIWIPYPALSGHALTAWLLRRQPGLV